MLCHSRRTQCEWEQRRAHLVCNHHLCHCVYCVCEPFSIAICNNFHLSLMSWQWQATALSICWFHVSCLRAKQRTHAIRHTSFLDCLRLIGDVLQRFTLYLHRATAAGAVVGWHQCGVSSEHRNNCNWVERFSHSILHECSRLRFALAARCVNADLVHAKKMNERNN